MSRIKGGPKSLRERLDLYIERRGLDECWGWRGKDISKFCGKIRDDAGNIQYAPRAYWILENGPIPDGYEICHTCPGGDNKGCMNLRHMRIDTHASNIKDLDSRDRRAKWGTYYSPLVLPDDTVRLIRRLLSEGFSLRRISEMLRVGQATVWRISKDISYKDVR